ncbi:endolytic transglycosylase MltG [Psychroflexus sp. CAK57W]|uniref:endolytic transglycosylase MltG n=1 Tax=Psychroflexus curvus TaxID=2873595 RepID=UPI001CCE15A2|nr:endolytic transglycosylase MltG [Psychroflexus curvus]MBZ9627713.1 endolytic transglycosylase MltG [Psychroflexus curvus]MBZ9786200.1 endolytic transglycosylase MltG [Psychroflexus curvus]
MYIKKILIAASVVGLIVLGGVSIYIYNVIFSPNTAFDTETKSVYVSTGSSLQEVVNQLHPFLKDTDNFITVANKKGYGSNVKAGHFVLKKDMNNNEIINTLRSGNVPIQVSFNNQHRLENLAGRVAEQIEADSLEILRAMISKPFLDSLEVSPLQSLKYYIPNTYEFYWDTSGEEFRNRMVSYYNEFWNENRLEKAEALNLSPQEVMSLAAIVQKETAKVEERPKVAGVYLNRLRRGMKLQADPSVIFAIQNQNQDFETPIKRVLYKDLELDSPYNTYKYKGVPPGLIAMPDVSSINAILNAESHDYLYFAANPENPGYHKFAKTLAQHNRNARAYQNWVNKQKIYR